MLSSLTLIRKYLQDCYIYKWNKEHVKICKSHIIFFFLSMNFFLSGQAFITFDGRVYIFPGPHQLGKLPHLSSHSDIFNLRTRPVKGANTKLLWAFVYILTGVH